VRPPIDSSRDPVHTDNPASAEPSGGYIYEVKAFGVTIFFSRDHANAYRTYETCSASDKSVLRLNPSTGVKEVLKHSRYATGL